MNMESRSSKMKREMIGVNHPEIFNFFKKTVPFMLLFVFLSCSSGHGNRVHGDNFSVYFSEDISPKIAEKVAFYWKENQFLTGEKQDIKIEKDENENYILFIIANFPEEVKEKGLTFEERKLLLELENDLYKVFSKEVNLMISDQNFNVIYSVE